MLSMPRRRRRRRQEERGWCMACKGTGKGSRGKAREVEPGPCRAPTEPQRSRKARLPACLPTPHPPAHPSEGPAWSTKVLMAHLFRDFFRVV